MSAALSLAAVAVAFALWGAGLLASLESLFVLGEASAPSVPPQTWVVLLLVTAAGLGAGLAVERISERRALLFVGAALALWCGASLAASRLLQLDVVFVPVALAALSALVAVQARRLWAIDAALARSIQRVASKPSVLEGRGANARLMSGLKLLDTVLPLEEAVIFRLDAAGAPEAAARLRASSANGAQGGADSDRNNVWREGVRLCERSVASGEILLQPGEGGERATVVVPLSHEGHAVGALLIRLREAFDESDRPLLLTVSAQFARNLQRDEARALDVPKARETFYSAPAAAQRLESFGVVSGLLAEQSFAAHVLAEASEGHAVAYLDGTLACVNAATLEAARVSAEECRALDLFGLLERFRTGVFDEPSIAVRRVLQTGQAYERELTYIERSQTLALRIALVTDVAFTKETNVWGRKEEGVAASGALPLCLAVTVRDVTRIKEYEKLKSDMLSLMSHELRTPITSINGFAELLMADENLPAESREFLGIIHTESQRLTRMIGTFLSVARLEQKDRQEVLMAPLMLDDVVRDTVSNFQSVAKRKRIRLVEKEGAKLPPVAADRSLITQVVSNLLDNAVKYSPERTTVTLSTALEADAVRFTVEDRGYGIPPEDVERVWEKFYRVARDGRVKEEESTGLGLSFVREVVEQHGGAVELESEVGRGSKFSFTLPRL
ncbi:MAG TPA: ATP-binding protein [Pyrinomonadaceae bacterium]|nr:ATP-binding protein [Pyrinomonadaceae bacterium]